MVKRIRYADDDLLSVGVLVRLRAPSLVVGLVLGVLLSFVTSRFEQVLSEKIEVAYFIPFVVYIADSVGTQTQNIYARDLRSGNTSFKNYLFKETLIGLLFGALFGASIGLLVMLWFGHWELASAVGLSTFVAISFAPLVALAITELLQLERSDPAVGAGPIATVIQDTLSVLIYGIIASWIVL